MLEEKKAIQLPHNIILEDRKLLSIAGVDDIDSFDENAVVLFTQLGELTVRGNNLHINKLNIDTGELTMDGEINALIYSDQQEPKKAGFFSKAFH